MEGERGGLWAGGCGDGEEVGAVDVREVDGGARVGRCGLELDVAEIEVADVAEEEAVGGHGAEHAGLGVLAFELWWLTADEIGGGSALVVDVDVGEPEVFDGEAGDAGEGGADGGLGVVGDEVVDGDAAEGAYFG